MTWKDEGDSRIVDSVNYSGHEPVSTFHTTDGKSVSIQGKSWGDIAIRASAMGLTKKDSVNSHVSDRLTTKGGVVILEEDLTPLYNSYGAVMQYKGMPIKAVTYDQLYAEAGKPTPRNKVGVAVIPVEEIRRVADEASSPLDGGLGGFNGGSLGDLKVMGGMMALGVGLIVVIGVISK